MASVVILGAKGRFGRAASAAFAEAGWSVVDVARQWPSGQEGAARQVADVTDPAALLEVCKGHDVIVNAVNPPYPDWAREIPRITEAVIAAGHACGATIMIPGNVYNYGADMPPVLTEETPWRAKTRKGCIRIRMENTYRESGVPTIVLRGGDFLEPARTGNWFDSHIAAKAWQGKLTYPGPRDVTHAWAYLPDMARAMAMLAGKRGDFDSYESFGFAGYGLDGDALIAAVEKVTGRKMRVSGMPWGILRLLGFVSPLMREVNEMRYLWQVPHQIDGTKLAGTLPEFVATPVLDAIAACLAPYAPD